MKHLLCLLLLFLGHPIPVTELQAAEIRVPADHPTIQEGIDAAAAGDMVLVAAGTYTGAGNTNLSFRGKAITVRSEKGPEQTIIDCLGSGRGVAFFSGEGTDSVLSGFSIINGAIAPDGGMVNNDMYSLGRGGAIYSGTGESPVIDNCILSGNTAGLRGGAIFTNQATVTNCRIQNNTSGGSAGGIELGQGEITDSTISGNKALDGSGGGILGGLLINRCTISNNTAKFQGGGIWQGGSGTISAAVITSNSAGGNGGGGIYLYDENGTPTIRNCVIKGNTSRENNGGGLFVRGRPFIVNCTLTNNTAVYEGGGIQVDSGSTPRITNTIVWQNAQGEVSGDGTPTVTYSDVKGGHPGAGNLDANPIFDPGDNFHLSATSPCIDTGSATGAPAEDIDGNPRPQGARFDMGADEFLQTPHRRIAPLPWLLLLIPASGSSGT